MLLENYNEIRPIRMAKIQNIDNTKVDKDVEQQELSFTAGCNAKWHSHFERQFGSFLQKLIMKMIDNYLHATT